MTREEWLLELKHETPDREEPLIILGHEVDKTNPEELYAALCWIEANLIQMLARNARRAADDLRLSANRFFDLAVAASMLAAAFLFISLQ